ncbi:BACON domain-containing protein [Alistipes provencensis]|uniref:BACON domain-containing protein n=1 Tax=Alistipes provencensis TaxID=1816676 RepID=UPI0011CA3451|nr:BACON domain-containing carbohydrate-binding protein [Alistipes provencensis]
MKNIFMRAAMLLAVGAMGFAFTACNDDDKQDQAKLTPETTDFRFTSGTYSKVLAVETEHLSSYSADVVYDGSETGWVTPVVQEGGVKITVQPNTASTKRSAKLVLSAPGVQDVTVAITQKAKFASELIGNYVPKVNTAVYDFGLVLSTEWNDNGAPSLPLNGDKDNAIEWGLVEYMLPMMVGAYYAQGLVGLELLDDGRVGAKYRSVTLENGLTDIFNPTFGEEVLSFPDIETLPIVPVDAISYYTQDGKIYLAVDKQFISKVDPGTLGTPIAAMIDGMIAKYKLGVVSNEEVFALPLKYKVEGDVSTLYVDREMILPFKGLLVDLIGQLVPDEGVSMGEEMAITKEDILKFVTDIFDNSTKFELGIKLTKQAK